SLRRRKSSRVCPAFRPRRRVASTSSSTKPAAPRAFTAPRRRRRFGIGIDRKENAMAVLSVMSIQGDSDELLARMQATLDPVAAVKAPQYGGISSTVVRTDDGIKIFNLWETEEGRHRMADDPEIQAAIRESGFPKPSFTGYEVLSVRSAAEGAKTLSRRIADEIWTQGKLDVIDEVI